MDRAKAKVLVAILKVSPLYETMPHEEKIFLLSQLEKDYPTIFNAEEGDDAGKAEESRIAKSPGIF